MLPVTPITASHLDKTRAKRHAAVFTKLRVLELPYRRVLLLDVDLLPRHGTNLEELFEVIAPAGKYHCSRYEGDEPAHGELLPATFCTQTSWSPNAGVMRLDPLPSKQKRLAQVAEMIDDVMLCEGESYLPEQYYLAEKLQQS